MCWSSWIPISIVISIAFSWHISHNTTASHLNMKKTFLLPLEILILLTRNLLWLLFLSGYNFYSLQTFWPWCDFLFILIVLRYWVFHCTCSFPAPVLVCIINLRDFREVGMEGGGLVWHTLWLLWFMPWSKITFTNCERNMISVQQRAQISAWYLVSECWCGS